MNGLPTRPETLSPGLQLLVWVGLLLAGYFLASIVALGVAIAIFHLSLNDISRLATPEQVPHGWAALMLLQGAGLAGAGAGAALLPVLVGQRPARYFAPARLRPYWLLLAPVLMLAIGPVLSVVIRWNAGVEFPAWAQGFGEWAREKEALNQALTSFLTNFTTGGRLLVGLLVIAVVPAVAEELVFRGGLQRNLVRLLGRHAGVWLAAAIFSAVHLQFLGFVPRLLLGAVLGYLYEWSGNILVPMAAHFAQNASQLLLLDLAQGGQLPTVLNPDANQTLPWPAVLLSAATTATLLGLLYQRRVRPASNAAVPTP